MTQTDRPGWEFVVEKPMISDASAGGGRRGGSASPSLDQGLSAQIDPNPAIDSTSVLAIFPNSEDASMPRESPQLSTELSTGRTVAALYVETDGCYFGLPEVDPWDEARDARGYAGPHPVVAHPPCQRWGRFWHGSTRKPHQFRRGEDGGCFAAALTAVRNYGGVLEHPAGSSAWEYFGLETPKRGWGWSARDRFGGRSCYVEQGLYGHISRKPTWLYAVVDEAFPPELDWSVGEQRIPQWMIDRYGYEKARRIGVVAMVGGKDKTRIRNATPEPFRDMLLGIARSAREQREKAA